MSSISKLRLAKLFAVCVVFAFLILSGCSNGDQPAYRRAMDPWAFRSVLDKQPRMLTLALDSSFFVAYDLARGMLYKAWTGGVTLEGTVYTGKKNVQPTSWGKSYFSDSLHRGHWIIQRHGGRQEVKYLSKGYAFHQNQIQLRFSLILTDGDTVHVEEQPEFMSNETGRPGLERKFNTMNVPDGVSVMLQYGDSTFVLKSNGQTRSVRYFSSWPKQFQPTAEGEYDHRGRYWMEKSNCMTCHEIEKKTVGPSFRQIADRYQHDKKSIEYLTRKITDGGSGVWGTTAMTPHPSLTEYEIGVMLDYVFTLKSTDTPKDVAVSHKPKIMEFKPGFGAPLEGLHPSYDVQTIHDSKFKPRVGGLAFLPDGRLVVATWDRSGSVYIMKGVETGDTSKITVKRIASGLAEPLGLTVVNNEIFVLQKHELTRLVDLDGDEVTDVYDAVCNQWGVTADFHEFAFGLVYKDGYFYATLSMAMRLLASEKELPDRGRTIRISRDGHYEWINYGLRTPNGIGLGVDSALFITDNQGEWVPGNKLIHVKKGEYHGMHWGLPDSLKQTPRIAPPAVWLPEDEIGNSPSEPVLIPNGPFRGQMFHGDVTHGGIQRDFIEKIDGEYQGAVFRFTQGLEAGINRLRWGPDGALYAGGIGMVGGWSWKEKQYGLQRLQYNGQPTFEMLAIRAKPKGFEIEFTIPLMESIRAEDILVQQWWYLPTQNYGGPKKDLENLKIRTLTISFDRKRVLLEIPGLKKEHVVYFRLADDLKGEGDIGLWTSESWYTLNNIPD